MGQSARHEKQRDVRAGLVCAEAFQRLSEPLIFRIASEVNEGRQEPSAELGDVVAAAVNLAFALELYLKTLLAQMGLPVPQHHNLRELYDAVPLRTKGQIQEKYDTAWRSEWNERRASITVAKGPPDPPIWDDYREKRKDISHLLERARDCFQSWRYVWEYARPPDTHYQFHEFEYGLLLSACVAVRAIIMDGLSND